MKKIFYVSLILVLVLGVAPSGHAEFYKFKNNQGVVVFTDDLAKVPENQREEAFQYEDSPSQDVSDDQNEVVSGDLAESPSLQEDPNSNDQLNALNPEDPGEDESQEISEEWNDVVSSGEEGDMEAETETEEVHPDSNESEITQKKTETENRSSLPDADLLNQDKILLDQEYLSLQAEKEMLEKSKPNLKSNGELQSYHEKIVNINERISDFEDRRKVYSDKVDAYNATSSD